MNEIVNTQTLLFLKSIQIGILFAVIYDLVRIFRKIIPHPNWLVQLEDSLYWLACAFIGFGILYIHNYGDIRLFIFLGMILGAVFYLLTLSIIFMRIATYIIELLRSIITYIVRIVSIPVKWCIGLLKIPVKIMYAYCNYLKAESNRKKKKMKQKYYYQQADKQTQKYIEKYSKPSDQN